MGLLGIEGESMKPMSIVDTLALGNLGGLRITESLLMLEEGPARWEELTWAERLFSWPWRPWVARKLVPTMVPSKSIYLIHDSCLLMHPVTARCLRDNIQLRKIEKGELWYLM